MMGMLSSSDLVPYLNQMFRVRLEGIEPIDLELVSMTELGEVPSTEHRRPFSLIFLGPISSQYLVQHIYRLEHPQMGMLDLFLVPLGPEQGRMRYEAIFN